MSPDFVIPSVTKYWDDNDNVFQKRPKEIKVNLLQNGTKVSSIPTVKLNKSNNWTFTLPEKDALPKYDDADQEYVYTWEEDTSALPKDYELTDTKNTTSSNGQYTYIHTDITNTYAKATSAQVSKSWDDENNLYKHRPESVTVHLLANGTQINKLTLEYTENGKTKQMNITDGNVVLSKENNWSVKAVNLPKYNGKNKITYSWSEETVPDYRLTSDVTITKEEGTALEYTETTLVNHFDVPKGSVTVSKLIPIHSLDFRHGNIDFTFTLNGTTIHNKEYIDKKTVKFTKDMSIVKDKIVTVGNKEYLKLSTVFEDLDWGDYKITESGSESRYQFDKISGLSGAVSGTEKDGTPYVSFTVDYDHKEFTGTFENRTNPASVKIIKYGNNKKDKLKGVTFKIEKILADKSTELTATKETDANGEITFSDLDPGDYQITETKTVNGHSLLKDPIKVTLPVALTQKEAADKRADTTKAKYDKTNGLYYFYDVTYDVDNEAIPSVPMTGAFDNWKTFVPIILAMALFIGVGIYQMKKRKKPVK
ncbi:Cna B-type domain-containing protein [Anaerobutyricum hallii]|uniref:Cna B-type domain-containing protein n=1 Tax=Anaerobutyricum hallii TaxID=39488 RepID=UPI002E8DD486|nr:Cna B-type domain-containing protein [Anaerobutyricum hallii]